MSNLPCEVHVYDDCIDFKLPLSVIEALGFNKDKVRRALDDGVWIDEYDNIICILLEVLDKKVRPEYESMHSDVNWFTWAWSAGYLKENKNIVVFSYVNCIFNEEFIEFLEQDEEFMAALGELMEKAGLADERDNVIYKNDTLDDNSLALYGVVVSEFGEIAEAAKCLKTLGIKDATLYVNNTDEYILEILDEISDDNRVRLTNIITSEYCICCIDKEEIDLARSWAVEHGKVIVMENAINLFVE